MGSRYHTKEYEEKIQKLQKQIHDVTGEYVRLLDISEYKGDGDLLCEGIWLDFLCKPVAEVCDEKIEEWEESKG